MTRPSSFLAVGRVQKPHGIHGELLVEMLTDFPQRLRQGVEVGVGHNQPELFFIVNSVRLHKGLWLLKLGNCDSREEAAQLRDQYLFLPEQDRQSLPPNYFYEHELVGLACELANGSPAGRVMRLEKGAGGAWLVVAVEDREVLVPFVSPIVLRVDLSEGKVVLDPPEGLIFGHAL